MFHIVLYRLASQQARERVRQQPRRIGEPYATVRSAPRCCYRGNHSPEAISHVQSKKRQYAREPRSDNKFGLLRIGHHCKHLHPSVRHPAHRQSSTVPVPSTYANRLHKFLPAPRTEPVPATAPGSWPRSLRQKVQMPHRQETPKCCPLGQTTLTYLATEAADCIEHRGPGSRSGLRHHSQSRASSSMSTTQAPKRSR